MRVVQRPARTVTALAAACLCVGILLPAAAVAQDEPVEGGTLVVAADGVAEPATLNPAITASNGVLYYAAKIDRAARGCGPGREPPPAAR